MLDTIVTIAGWIFLGLLGLVGLGVAFVLFQLWRLKRALGPLAGLDGAEVFATEIELTPDSDIRPAGEAARWQAELHSAGWEPCGSFTAPVMGGLTIHAMCDQRSYVAIYENRSAGTWIDLVAWSADEPERLLTVTNSSLVSEGDAPPWNDRVVCAGAGVEELVTAFRRQVDQAGWALRPCSTAEFKTSFQEAFRRDQEWRLGRGGPTRDEIARTLAAQPGRIAGATIDRIYGEHRAQALEHLAELCIGRVLDQEAIPASRARQLHERLFVVHDAMTGEELLTVLDEHLDLPEDCYDDDGRPELDLDDDQPATLQIATVIDDLPASARPDLLGSGAEPIACRVYVAPE